jgi:hypothetical protein
MKFKRGDKVVITGHLGGCEWTNGKSCFECQTFKGQVLTVETPYLKNEIRPVRNITCKDDAGDRCDFAEEDLSLATIDWERIL